MTFTKSYTTRRSHPMIRSRLRSPMSKSTTATRLPRCASPHAMLADVVVFPTPPLPEVTTIISANAGISYELICSRRTVSGTDAGEMQILAFQPGLHGAAGKLGGNRLEDAKHAGDRHEFGIKFLAENPAGKAPPAPRPPRPRAASRKYGGSRPP